MHTDFTNWLDPLRKAWMKPPDQYLLLPQRRCRLGRCTAVRAARVFAAIRTCRSIWPSFPNRFRARLPTLRKMVTERPEQHFSSPARLRACESRTDGRKCEFGESRSRELQHADIAAGKELLSDLLGPITDPIFTPPWNRCTASTAALLTARRLHAFVSRHHRDAAQHSGSDGASGFD